MKLKNLPTPPVLKSLPAVDLGSIGFHVRVSIVVGVDSFEIIQNIEH